MCSCYPIKDGGCQYPLKHGEATCKCKRRYDDIEVSNISILENGYPQYRRQKKNLIFLKETKRSSSC